MKIRIKGNSVRLRLSKSDVEKLAHSDYIEERTFFGLNTFVYALKSSPDTEGLNADYENGKITLYIPGAFVQDWAENDVVGIDSIVKLNDKEQLFLLIEKDFKCIEQSAEDQSDNFDKPNSDCS